MLFHFIWYWDRFVDTFYCLLNFISIFYLLTLPLLFLISVNNTAILLVTNIKTLKCSLKSHWSCNLRVIKCQFLTLPSLPWFHYQSLYFHFCYYSSTSSALSGLLAVSLMKTTLPFGEADVCFISHLCNQVTVYKLMSLLLKATQNTKDKTKYW